MSVEIKKLTGLIIFVFLGCIITGIAITDFSNAHKWVHLPIHSTIETLGGISAILTALVLLLQNKADNAGVFFLLSTGFACMGVLDTFHAMSLTGNAFVFLHSAASLAGGFFFMLAWLPDTWVNRYSSEQKWITGISIVISLSVGLRALLFPDSVPAIIHFYDGQFTQSAVIMNTLASILFLAAAPRLYTKYKSTTNDDYLVFMFLAILFGLAELIFQYSDTWDAIWWIWHVLRFSAYILTLYFVVRRHFQLAKNAYHNNPSCRQ